MHASINPSRLRKSIVFLLHHRLVCVCVRWRFIHSLARPGSPFCPILHVFPSSNQARSKLSTTSRPRQPHSQRQLLVPLNRDLKVLFAFNPVVLAALLVPVFDLKRNIVSLALATVLKLQLSAVDNLLVQVCEIELTARRHADHNTSLAVEPSFHLDWTSTDSASCGAASGRDR